MQSSTASQFSWLPEKSILLDSGRDVKISDLVASDSGSPESLMSLACDPFWLMISSLKSSSSSFALEPSAPSVALSRSLTSRVCP